MVHRSSLAALAGPEARANLGLSSVSSLMWMAACISTVPALPRMGQWGAPIGWPVMTATSIGVGIVLGAFEGDWRGAPRAANAAGWRSASNRPPRLHWLGFANRV